MYKNVCLSICFILIIVQSVNANTCFCSADTGIENKLTKQEQQQGWKLLFDGNSMNGWRTYKNRPGSWKINDGVLCSERSGDSSNADLISIDTFENFEIVIDWKISSKGNSGIMYHVNENYDQDYESGPEYQLIDDDGFPEHIEDWQKTGAAYAIQPPAMKAANKPGEWNHTIIIANKNHVEHWLNGKKLVQYEFGSNEWKKQKETGKWKDEPGYGMSKSGHFALQAAHSNIADTYIFFRNIKIKLL